jgi:hypothetical protein
LEARGFELQQDPGKWKTSDGIQVDLLVPEALAGPGRRAARLPGHGKKVSRRAKGIEGALVDAAPRPISALHSGDGRVFVVSIAGPAALFIAKVHKIAERVDQPDRLVEKDALDVLRLLRAVALDDLIGGMHTLLDSDLAGDVTHEALDLADDLLRQPDHAGPQMAARAAGGLEDPDVIAASLAALYTDLATALSTKRS